MTGRLFVLGNAMLDETFRMPALPEPGETVVATGLDAAPGGKGLNQAVVAARAGAAVRFRTAIGQDTAAGRVAAALRQEPRLSVDWLYKPTPTDRSVILVGADGENCIVSFSACAEAVTAAEAGDFAAEAMANDLLLMQGNLELAATRAAVAASRAPVLLNVAPVRWPVDDLLSRCAAIVVNQIEARQITGQNEPAAAARQMMASGLPVAIVTLGAAGSILGEAGAVSRHPVRPVAVVDSAGAGDAFCGALAAARLAGRSWADALSVAQSAASFAVQRSGCFAALPQQHELGPGNPD